MGVGWTAACVAEPALLGDEGLWTTRLLIALFGALAFGAVGLADDLARLRRHAPLGLRRPVRLGLEAAAAAAVQVLLAANHCLATGLVLPGLGYCELGVLAPIVWGMLLVGLAESARVADGADGVVCGSAFLGMLGLMGAMTILGWFPLGVLPAALAGALMALLLWNFPPAKLLPGSVGSLFLAGALGCVPLSIGWPGLSVPLGLPYWLEGGMVALQILVYQASKGRKQLFGTAPLHRWLEKRGRAPISIFTRSVSLPCWASHWRCRWQRSADSEGGMQMATIRRKKGGAFFHLTARPRPLANAPHQLDGDAGHHRDLRAGDAVQRQLHHRLPPLWRQPALYPQPGALSGAWRCGHGPVFLYRLPFSAQAGLAGVSALSGTAGAGAVQHAAQRLPPLDLVRRLYGAGIGDR